MAFNGGSFEGGLAVCGKELGKAVNSGGTRPGGGKFLIPLVS